MYTQIFLVTSVRGMDFPPQISANALLLHHHRILLGRCTLRLLARCLLLRGDLLQRCLRNGRRFSRHIGRRAVKCARTLEP